MCKVFLAVVFAIANMQLFGTEILINNSQKIGDEETVQKLKDAIIKNADASVETAQKSAFLYESLKKVMNVQVDSVNALTLVVVTKDTALILYIHAERKETIRLLFI